MTDDEIKRLRALCEAATPGPWAGGNMVIGADEMVGLWEWFCPVTQLPDDVHEDEANRRAASDARFIAAARTALPELLDEVERLREVLGNVEFYLRNSGIEEMCAPALIEQVKPFRVGER